MTRPADVPGGRAAPMVNDAPRRRARAPASVARAGPPRPVPGDGRVLVRLPGPARRRRPPRSTSLILFLIAASVMLTYPFVGTLLAVRRPRNPLGWLLLLLGLGFTLSFFSTEYLGRAHHLGVAPAWRGLGRVALHVDVRAHRVDPLRVDPAPVPDRTRALAALGARGLGDRDRDGRRDGGRCPRPRRARRGRRGVHEPRQRPGPRGADRRDQRPVHAGHRDPRRAVSRVAAAPLPPVAGR